MGSGKGIPAVCINVHSLFLFHSKAWVTAISSARCAKVPRLRAYAQITVSLVPTAAPAYLVPFVMKLKRVASGFGHRSSVRSGRVQVTFSRISRQSYMGCLVAGWLG